MSFIWLVFAHFLGDIALQSSWQADNKGRYWYVLLSHCIIWTATVSVALVYVGRFSEWNVPFLIIGHGIADFWKARQPKDDAHWRLIYPDQAWHFAQLAIVFAF